MIRLSTSFLLAAVLLSTGCDIGEEKSEDQRSPVPNRWQVDAPNAADIDGMWISQGEAPVFPVHISQEIVSNFRFDADYEGNGADTWHRFFTRFSDVVGTINNQQLTWTNEDESSLFGTATLSATYDKQANTISGTMTREDGRTEDTFNVEFIPFDVAISDAKPLDGIGNTLTFENGQAWFVFELREAQEFTRVSTGGTNMWAFLFDEDGDLITQNDESPILGPETYIEANLSPGTYYLLYTNYSANLASGQNVNISSSSSSLLNSNQ